MSKVELATILGTLQARKTKFRYLSSQWEKNTIEEALLGVSLTGIMDNPVLSGRASYDQGFTHPLHGGKMTLQRVLQELRDYAVTINEEWADELGINPSMAVTCVKPSGTVSQLVDAASGIHPRYSEYYIRTVRADKKDPLAMLMKDQGFPVEDDFMKPDTGYVFSFPMKAPSEAVFRDDVSAIDQLELWKTYQLNWCEHKPSITVYVKEDEWLKVGAWVYANFDIVSGISFLPHSNHTYQQAPYQEVSQEEYLSFLERMPVVNDWSKLGEYEKEDTTTGMKEYACTGGACEIV